MLKSNHQEKFMQFRTQFPWFAFEKQAYKISIEGLRISYTFNLSGKYTFHPTYFIPAKGLVLSPEQLIGKMDAIVFNLGMIELISYWKACCSPRLIIRPFQLSSRQIEWWKKLYFNGLGEFFYLNSISSGLDDFMKIEVDSRFDLPLQHYTFDDTLIIPVGGGKDSAVTLELLKHGSPVIPLVMNPRSASLNTIKAAGFEFKDFLEIERSLDTGLLRLNEKGFLNGHTPFSALLAFVTVLTAILTGHRHIALSNESSANEATIDGTNINHQYSKSVSFESDFRDYISEWISPEINYFSFLRPVSELQIARLFSSFQQYHPVFRSCNAGSKTDSWCGKCAKCLFTYIILSPFLPEEQLIQIFGKNLLRDSSLRVYFDQLCGLTEEKPFDCVGTITEVNLALCETIRQRKNHALPELLENYFRSELFTRYRSIDFQYFMKNFDTHHFLPPNLEQRLKTVLND